MISLIVAKARNNVIGRGNDLAWNHPEDLRYFRNITKNKAVIMGYNTYLSIYGRLGKLLPNRENYVITFEKELPGDPIIVQGDVEQFMKDWPEDKELFIIGGKSIYELLYKYASKLYITEIDEDVDGDVYLNISLDDYTLESSLRGNNENLTFNIYKKK